MERTWLQFLLEEDGRSHYIDEQTEANMTSGQQIPLEHSYDGWEDVTVGYDRDMKRKGAIRSFSFDLKFVKDGAKIIRNIIYRLGFEWKLFFLLTLRTQIFDNVGMEFKDYHTRFYRGRVELSSAMDEEDSITVKCTEPGLAALIKANENTKYEFDLADPEAVVVNFEGVPLADVANFFVPEEGNLISGDHLIGCGMSSREGGAPGFAGHDVLVQSVPGDLTTHPDYLFDTTQDVPELEIDGELNFISGDLFGSPEFTIKLKSSKGAEVILADNISVDLNVPKKVTFSEVFPSTENERWFFISEGATGTVRYLESRFTIRFKSTYKNTVVPFFRPYVLIDKLLEKIAGKRGLLVSTLLQTPFFSNYALTSGDGLRSLPGAKVKISLNEALDIYAVAADAGTNIKGEKFYIENSAFFFPPTVNPIPLNDVTKVKITPAKSLLGNKVVIGWKEAQVEGQNGKFSFNNTHEYSTPSESDPNELKFVANCIADPFAIENTRINFEGQTTTDTAKDNDLFMVHIEQSNTTAVLENDATLNGQIYNISGQVMFDEYSGDEFALSPSKLSLTYKGSAAKAVELIFTVQAFSADTGSITVNLNVNGSPVAMDTFISHNTPSTHVIQATVTLNPTDVVTIDHTFIYQSDDQYTFITAMLQLKVFDALSWIVFRRPYTVSGGIPAGNKLFNLHLTPKSLLLLHQKWLDSLHYKLAGKKYKFQTTQQFSDLAVDRNGLLVIEKADLDITSNVYFLPFFFELEVSAPVDLVSILEADPFQPFEFEWLENTYRGFLIRAGSSPDDSRPQVFRLLCTPDTNLLPLITL
jgi:hypothetical protein